VTARQTFSTTESKELLRRALSDAGHDHVLLNRIERALTANFMSELDPAGAAPHAEAALAPTPEPADTVVVARTSPARPWIKTKNKDYWRYPSEIQGRYRAGPEYGVNLMTRSLPSCYQA
jgi:hypothetical protein